MTDQEFRNFAFKFLAGLWLCYMLFLVCFYLVLSTPEPVKEEEYVSYDYQLMMLYSDVHRAELLAQ